MKTFRWAIFAFTMLFLSLPLFSQWIVQHSGLAPSQNPTLLFTAVDSNVCWGIQSEIVNPQCILTTDGGDHWNLIQLPVDTGLIGVSIFAQSRDIAWIALDDPVGTARGGIFKTTDGGSSWIKQSTAFPGSGGHARTIHFFDSVNGICSGRARNGYWEIYTTTNGGTDWIRVPSSSIPEMDPGDLGGTGIGADNCYWFNSGSCSVYWTTDRGLTWSVERYIFPSPAYFLELAFKDSLNGLAISYYGDEINKVSSTADGGATWTRLPGIPSPPSASRISYVPGTSGTYFVTSFENIGYPEPTVPGSAYTEDGGLTWNLVDSLPHKGTSFANNRTGWSGGCGDTIFKWNGFPLGIADHSISSNLTLSQNYPNPFSSSTSIQYRITSSSRVILTVCDVQGRVVETLVNDEKPAGTYNVTFNSKGLSRGIYYYSLRSEESVQTKKMCIN